MVELVTIISEAAVGGSMKEVHVRVDSKQIIKFDQTIHIPIAVETTKALADIFKGAKIVKPL